MISPALIQARASSLTLAMTLVGKAEWLLKTQAFRSFHISQQTSIMMDRKPHTKGRSNFGQCP